MVRRVLLVLTLLMVLGGGLHMVAGPADAQVSAQVESNGAAPTAPTMAVTVMSSRPQPDLATAWRAIPPAQRPLAVGSCLLLVAVSSVLLWLATSTDMLRDGAPQSFAGLSKPNGKPLRRPFSLAQTQMAWWFVIVLAAYLYLFLVTGELDTLTGQALCLMGLGSGTAIGAVMVEQTKTNPILTAYQATLVQTADPTTPADAQPALALTRGALALKLASRNFLHDILTDANGISLHRFQSVVWTFVLGVLFLVEVVVHRCMPDFDPYTLGVLGISAGTYLGFKIPEQPN